MKPVIVFDVNETLLDLAALDPLFERIFGDRRVKGQWFARLLHGSLVVTLADVYHDFGAVARAALNVTARQNGVDLAEDDAAAILGTMRRLPPHPDVPPALAQLGAAGFRLATLTNSPPPVLTAQIANAGLGGYFERLLSVDMVRQFKPAPATYQAAAAALGVAPAEMCMVAAHDWDTAGALGAGCLAAYVARPGMHYNELLPRPAVFEPNMTAVAAQLIAMWGDL